MRKENTGVPSQTNVVISLIYLCRTMVSSRPSIPYRVDQHCSVLHTLLNAAHDERFPPQLLPPTSVMRVALYSRSRDWCTGCVWELHCTLGQGIGVLLYWVTTKKRKVFMVWQFSRLSIVGLCSWHLSGPTGDALTQLLPFCFWQSVFCCRHQPCPCSSWLAMHWQLRCN